MQPPLIGVTCSRISNKQGYPQSYVSEAYTSALVLAGATPLIIPSVLDDDSLQAVLRQVDGIVLTGGGDIHPAIYSDGANPLASDVDIRRDRIEMLIVDHILRNRMPFLGICRGIQVLNVAMGGNLYLDILEQRPDSIGHQNQLDLPRDHFAHSIQVEENSQLANLLGGLYHLVNSLHHQAINRPAIGLRVSAYAPDGVIEAVEVMDHPFGIAVQWHPENLQAHSSMQGLFKALARAAIENKDAD